MSRPLAIDDEDRGEPRAGRLIVVRRVKPAFESADISRWFRGDRFRTAYFTAYTLILADESEFVGIVRAFLPQVQAPRLRKPLKAWLGQETTHGVQHIRAQQALERGGLRFRGFLAVVRFVYYTVIARLLGRRLMLGVVAGLEHFNTMLAEICLRDPEYFRGCDRELALLLRWHLAEEIEHRAVVHDVAVHVGIGRFTRVFTGFIAFFFFSTTLFVTAGWFALQTGDVFRLSTYRQGLRFLFTEERFAGYFVRYLSDYCRRDFHPLGRHTDALAERVLEDATITPQAPIGLAEA